MAAAEPVANAVVEHPFGARFAANETGAIAVVGNALESCPSAAAGCAAARAGRASPLSTLNNNNNHDMRYVDADGHAGTFDTSSATLTLPPAARVQFAGLYFGGRTSAGADGAAAPAAAQRDRVKLLVPGAGSYETLVARALDSSPRSRRLTAAS